MTPVFSTQDTSLRLPPGFRKRIQRTPVQSEVFRLLRHSNLNTVCEEAKCPNIAECFSNKTATFMILGDRCTRRCQFCSVKTKRPLAVDPKEPENLKNAVLTLGLKHVVITSVDRDELQDYGAKHFSHCIARLKEIPELKIELLTPDFKGQLQALEIVKAARADIWGHNAETVPRLYKQLRPQSNWETTLKVIDYVANQTPSVCKTGLMVGLGESDDEVSETLVLLKKIGVEIVTIGQYLRPSLKHWPVARYVPEASYKRFRQEALDLGFKAVYAAPYVRSSYHAKETYLSMRGPNEA